MTESLGRRLGAEFLGTFWLVFGGCGAAVFAANFLQARPPAQDGVLYGGRTSFTPIQYVDTGLGIGFLGVSLAFGLTVLTGAYAFGAISGGHFNPAITIGLVVARRFGWTDGKLDVADIVGYIVIQVAGGLVAGAALLGIANSLPGFSTDQSGLAANGYGSHSPGGYNLSGALIIEILLTAFFVLVILGVTDSRAVAGFAPLAIGLTLTLIHLISIPIDNTSVNPARSTGVAFYAGNGAPGQLWLFWLAPVIGGVVAGVIYPLVFGTTMRPRPGRDGKRTTAGDAPLEELA